MHKHLIPLLLLVLLANGCIELGFIGNYQPPDGEYSLESYACENELDVYLESCGDTINLWTDSEAENCKTIISLPENFHDSDSSSISYSKNGIKLSKQGIDIDLLTVLFKYRPATSGFPRQLNTDLSGALYLGYRKDAYRIDFYRIPAGYHRRTFKHFGYSIGFFTGIGSTAMNPWVTNDFVPSEYDGMVWMNGIAGLVGVGDITFGLVYGADFLLDVNRHYWIYQNKPWAGMVLGINLN